MFIFEEKQHKVLFRLIIELDSDFDSRDGSDNENESSVKYDVRIQRIRLEVISLISFRTIVFRHRHHLLLVHPHLVRRIFVIVVIAVVMFV